MRLALRLALTFGLLAAGTSALVGVAVRYRLGTKETDRFRNEVESACPRIQAELDHQGAADIAVLHGMCQGGELVERVGIALDRGDLDERRTGFSQIVSSEREAFGFDELVLAADKGDVVGVSPVALIGLPAREVDALLKADDKAAVLRTTGRAALVTRCRRKSDGGHIAGLVGARYTGPILSRFAATLGVAIVVAAPGEAPVRRAAPLFGPVAGDERARCKIEDREGHALSFDVVKSRHELEENLAEVDAIVFVAAAVSALVAFILAVFFARGVSRPLSVLATEAGKVAAGEAHPLVVRGSGEVRDLVSAFDRMLHDLAITRRRLAAASRVAAWREVARRVAHEVKNPLAPIRAAVETLRRLRAREDPRFDEYFDEATRTVLDEVHRISNIVTEFTRFARLPSPRLVDVDVDEVARHVIHMHEAEDRKIVLERRRASGTVRADRDQVIQVLTNLVQNALDSAGPGGHVAVTTDTEGHYVSWTVTDDGHGIAPEIATRLFEPYATNKASGTGLGLAIAQRIAIEHDGELSYLGTSGNGRGAVFRLVLPIKGPPPMSEVPPSDT